MAAHKQPGPPEPKPVQQCIGWATRRFGHNHLIYNKDDAVWLEYDQFQKLMEAGAVTQEQPWTPPPPPVPVPPEVQTKKPLPKGKLEKAAAGLKTPPERLETHDLQARLEKLEKG